MYIINYTFIINYRFIINYGLIIKIFCLYILVVLFVVRIIEREEKMKLSYLFVALKLIAMMRN